MGRVLAFVVVAAAILVVAGPSSASSRSCGTIVTRNTDPVGVKAVNLSCAKARKVIKSYANHGFEDPAGWACRDGEYPTLAVCMHGNRRAIATDTAIYRVR